MNIRNVLVLVFLLGALSQAATKDVLIIGKNATAFHLELYGKTVILDDEIGDEVRVTPYARDHIFLDSLLGNTIPDRNFEVRTSRGLKNGFALMWGPKRLIVYDSESYWDQVDRVLVLAHEVGHHICGHTIEQRDFWTRELEADSVVGAVVAGLEKAEKSGGNWATGVSIYDVVQAAWRKYQEQGTKTHPPRQQRIDAIINGYAVGHRCRRR